MKTATYITMFLLFATGIFSYQRVLAQSASTNQIGLRLGGFSGVTFRSINSSDVGIEANLLANYHGDWAMLSILAEKHVPIGSGFTLFIGGGGFFAGDNNYPDIDGNRNDWQATVGLEGVMGVDYYFEEAPLNLGIDLRPRFSFLTDPFVPWDAGISFRYIF